MENSADDNHFNNIHETIDFSNFIKPNFFSKMTKKWIYFKWNEEDDFNIKNDEFREPYYSRDFNFKLCCLGYKFKIKQSFHFIVSGPSSYFVEFEIFGINIAEIASIITFDNFKQSMHHLIFCSNSSIFSKILCEIILSVNECLVNSYDYVIDRLINLFTV